MIYLFFSGADDNFIIELKPGISEKDLPFKLPPQGGSTKAAPSGPAPQSQGSTNSAGESGRTVTMKQSERVVSMTPTVKFTTEKPCLPGE